ncbi:glutathione S-transferase N-terminal domain-containing protein [Lysobacter humi (ex Lee et al. 2017)]
MRLVYTPRSHFSRKVRLLAAGLGLPLELVDAGNVADGVPAAFGPNPLMKVPTLIAPDGTAVFDSDHIAAWLVRRHDPHDRFGVLSDDVDVLNARAVMNGVMATEVELILAARTGIDVDAHARFAKMRASMLAGLDWLEAHHHIFQREATYATFHLLALLDHLVFYGLVPLAHPRLAAVVAELGARPSSPPRRRARRTSTRGRHRLCEGAATPPLARPCRSDRRMPSRCSCSGS